MGDLPALEGPWYRIQAITAAPRSATAEWDFVSVLPAMLSAARQGRSFVIGWLCRGEGTPLELITNGVPLTAHDPQPADQVNAGLDGLEQALGFPRGARGTPIGAEWLTQADRMVWTACPGRQAPDLLGDHREPHDSQRPTLFESTLVTLMSRPFGWLVIAQPTDLLEAEMAELRTQLNVMRQYTDASERHRYDVERAERRIQELDAFREAGLWDVRVLAGAASAADLTRVAPVLVGSVELSHHPYRLRSGRQAHELAAALDTKMVDATDDAAVPFAATAGPLAALAGLPRREVPGLRVIDAGYFDVTSEADARTPAGASVELGAILDGQNRPVGAFTLPLRTLNRHAFVAGATGAGKSQTVRHLLEQLTRGGIPWLAIEPAKSEYAAMAGRIAEVGEVTVVNPADPRAVPLSVNPLAPEPGYPVQAHIDMVRALFQAAFDAEEPFPQIMSQALQRVYEVNGWDVVTGAGVPGAAVPPATPTLEQLQQAALAVIEDVGYGRELQADVRGFVDVRLRSLRIGSAGRFFEGGHPADVGSLLRRNVVLAIEDVANDEDKAFLMGTLIIRVVEHLRLRARQQRAHGLRHVIVIEEAHRLLRNRGEQRASAHAVELFAGMLAEIRAYGEGIVVAEQIPTKLVPDVVKNTALKVVHRLPAGDDRQLVGAAMNLDEEQSRQVVSLEPGVAAVFADGMDRPVRIRVPFGESRERLLPSAPPPIDGRRSAACGVECRGRACTLYELREADLMAAGAEAAWLRVWVETLVLAFCTNRTFPGVPRSLSARWAALPARLRQCLVATVVEGTVARRAWALRTAYDPSELVATVAGTADQLLRGDARRRGGRAGERWVIPQLRWLHEVDRLFPHATVAPAADAEPPAMDFPALLDSSDEWHRGGRPKLSHRARSLRRHPLSMEIERNRMIAWRAIFGDDNHQQFQDDLATVAIGVDRQRRAARVGNIMGVSSWLETVLSWPHRFISAFEDPTTSGPFSDG